MGDLIKIAGIKIPVFIGVPEEERRQAQTIRVSIEMKVPSFTAAARRDNLQETVNYYDVTETVKAVAGQRPRKLLETLGEEIAAEILRRFAVEAVTVEIHKYILPDTDYVAVRLTRSPS